MWQDKRAWTNGNGTGGRQGTGVTMLALETGRLGFGDDIVALEVQENSFQVVDSEWD